MKNRRSRGGEKIQEELNRGKRKGFRKLFKGLR
jgi:hypothetical protein